MGKPDVNIPPPPNPTTVANAQTTSNVDTAIATALLNNISTTGPAGSTTIRPVGAYNVNGQLIPTFQQNTTLTPTAQEQFDASQQLGLDLTNLGFQGVDLISGALGSGIDTSGLPDVNVPFGEASQQAQNAVFSRGSALLNEQFDRNFRDFEIRLAERGIPIGSEIFNDQLDILRDSRNEAFTNLALDSVGAGNALQQQQFGQALQGRQQGFQEQAAINALPFNQLASILGTAPGVQTPNFNPFVPSQIAPTDVIGAHLGANQLAQNAASLQLSQPSLFGSLLGLGGQLGSAAIMASDRNAKENFEEVDPVLPKLEEMSVLKWNYRGDDKTHIGPMAQDFAKHFGGDGLTIHAVDANGVLVKAVQELIAENKALAERVEALENE